VNGVTVNIPSFLVKAGDVITIKANKANNGFWTNFQLQVPNDVPTWIDASKKSTIKILNLPLETDLPPEVNIGSIVEWYSRKVS
jgi:small subunit ribosomal protein S4